MKQECFFDIKDGSLFFKSDGKKLSLENALVFDAASESFAGDAPLGAASGSVVKVRVPLSCVVLPDGNYNESLLAVLRTFLKKLEAAGVWAIVLPVCAGAVASASAGELAGAGAARATGESLSVSECVSAISHTARRVKDCASVVGVEIPAQFSEQDSAALVAELSRKHGHYVYFRNGKAQDVRF